MDWFKGLFRKHYICPRCGVKYYFGFLRCSTVIDVKDSEPIHCGAELEKNHDTNIK